MNGNAYFGLSIRISGIQYLLKVKLVEEAFIDFLLVAYRYSVDISVV